MFFPWRQFDMRTEKGSVLSSACPPSCYAPICSLLLIWFSLLFLIIPNIFHLHGKDFRLKLAGVWYPSLPFRRDPWSWRFTYARDILPIVVPTDSHQEVFGWMVYLLAWKCLLFLISPSDIYPCPMISFSRKISYLFQFEIGVLFTSHYYNPCLHEW